jgi:hypothetical protein
LRIGRRQAIAIDATTVTTNVITNAAARSQKSSRRRWVLRLEICVLEITTLLLAPQMAMLENLSLKCTPRCDGAHHNSQWMR